MSIDVGFLLANDFHSLFWWVHSISCPLVKLLSVIFTLKDKKWSTLIKKGKIISFTFLFSVQCAILFSNFAYIDKHLFSWSQYGCILFIWKLLSLVCRSTVSCVPTYLLCDYSRGVFRRHSTNSNSILLRNLSYPSCRSVSDSSFSFFKMISDVWLVSLLRCCSITVNVFGNFQWSWTSASYLLVQLSFLCVQQLFILLHHFSSPLLRE